MRIKKLFFIFILLLLLPLTSCGKKSYDVSDDYFELISYDLTSYSYVLGYDLKIKGRTKIDVYEIGGEIYCYDKNDNYTGTMTFIIEEEYGINDEFSKTLYFDSNKKNTTRIEVEFYGKSHIEPKLDGIVCTIVLDNNNGTPNTTKKVPYGKPMAKPKNPEKENYQFLYWCTDKKLSKEYDFSKKVKSNITLYAKYEIDYVKLNDSVNDKAIKSDVTIITTSYNNNSSYGVQGSGVVIFETSQLYYILTNCHVVQLEKGYKNRKFSVEDCYGNEYEATFVAQNSEYDLGLLTIKKKGTKKLNVISFADSNPTLGDIVVSISQPNGQRSTVSYGEVIKIGKAPVLSNGTQVSCDVIISSAKTASGSSGGALLNIDLNLVGLHYAGATSKEGEFVQGYEIPVETIKLFVSKYIDI